MKGSRLLRPRAHSTHPRPRPHTGLGPGSAFCCPNCTRLYPISRLCTLCKVYAKHAPESLNCSELLLLQLSRVINNISYPRTLFAGEGIKAGNVLPPPASGVCISSKSRGSFTYANGINGESLQPGSQKQELCSYDFKLHTRVP